MFKKSEVEKSFVRSNEEMKDIQSLIVPQEQLEALSHEEMSIPFLRIAQKMSGVVNPRDSEYIEGIEVGHYYNTVSGENYGDKLVVQQHAYFRGYTKWTGIKGKEKYVGSMSVEAFEAFSSENELEKDGGALVQTINGERISYYDTRSYVITLPEYPEAGVMLYHMKSTGIKHSKKWNTLWSNRKLNGQPTARYATVWELKTGDESNDSFDWVQTTSITALGWADEELTQNGQEKAEMVLAIKKEATKTVKMVDSPRVVTEDLEY